MIPLEGAAIGAEVVTVVADAIGAAECRAALIRRVGDAEARRPSTVEVGCQRTAIVVGDAR